MLGLQETKSAGSPKTYSCVACSATFHNLASLLVHQATHASEISSQTESTLPTCDSCGSLFASKDLLEKHHCIMSASPVSPAQTYICECGEEFSGVTALEAHKKQHGPENKDKSDLGKIPIVPDSKINSSRPVSDQVFHSLSPSHSNEKSLAESAPPTSNADIKKTESSADMESNILKPFESPSVTEEQVQILEMDTLTSSGVVREEQVQILEMDTFKSSDVVEEEQVQILEMDTLKSSDVVEEEQVQILEMDTLKSSDVVEEEQVQIRDMDIAKSSDVGREEQEQIHDMDTLKSSNMVGEEQVE
ncbi:zinc finger and BTB domain-containing protein 24-like, partial [Rhinichthys klamathensis goyatoka]|uniref:zinc finger and BTB domain-containing protein 24-like n=1 Tax=Rhinichthys klamathensis goyatoka TaxID=3034132 RepID=UPI0024B5944C